MSKPLVAIVGKPNVGKSTFFNKVCGKRISIVSDEPGVTRDRLYGDASWQGTDFCLIDTGGIQLKSDDILQLHIKKQAEIAMELSDVILFFVDGKYGLTVEDMEVAQILRKTNKPLFLVVNKVDNFTVFDPSDFYKLGMDIYPVSSEHMQGIGDLLDDIVKCFDKSENKEEEQAIKIAVVGKPNAGKSSLVNKLLGYERAIVTPIAGTTRDSLDTPLTINDKNYIIIDTAGIRRKRSIEDESLERYSVMRSLDAIRRADVCWVVFDANEDLSEQDVKIAGYVHEQGKPSVIVINKWDLIEKDTYTVEKFKKKLACDLAFMDYAKSITVSALSGQRLNKLMEFTDYVFEKASFRATTGILNEVVADAVSLVEPPTKNGKRLKIKYATQPTSNPPTFVLFVNDADLMHFSYRRYLENTLRKAFSLDGTPIKLFIRSSGEDG
jgi:GTP-binding protein